jgi:hypothetical protein
MWWTAIVRSRLLNDQSLDHEFLDHALAADLHALVQILSQVKKTARSLDLSQRHGAQVGEDILTDLAGKYLVRSIGTCLLDATGHGGQRGGAKSRAV